MKKITYLHPYYQIENGVISGILTTEMLLHKITNNKQELKRLIDVLMKSINDYNNFNMKQLIMNQRN